MATRSQFAIFEQKQPSTNKPFMIVETMLTSDGPRSRICEGRYETFTEADLDIRMREELQKQERGPTTLLGPIRE